MREDIIKTMLEILSKMKLAAGKVDGEYVVVCLGHVSSREFIGWVVQAQVTKGSLCVKREERFASYEEAKKYFDEMVKKYNLVVVQ